MTAHPLSAPSPYTAALWAGRTVGLLGGSFNPAHDGHRHISLEAMKLLGLDAVWWMVSPQNPLKPVSGMATLANRVASARDVSAHPRIVVTDIEQALGTRYTADTLAALGQHFPKTRFIWLMGGDNLRQMHRWKNSARIFAQTPIAVLARPPQGDGVKNSPTAEAFKQYRLPESAAMLLKDTPPPAWVFLHIPLNPLSSTAIRAKTALRDKP